MKTGPGYFKAVIYFLLISLFTGCAGFIERSEYPDVKSRLLPEVSLGREIVLINKADIDAAQGLKILTGKDGRAHLFAVDKKKRVHHVEVLGPDVIGREVLGIAAGTASGEALDAVEHPSGTLRVLSGGTQFIRTGKDIKWREIKGSLCSRFIPVGDDLLCAFIANGKDIGAPKRTDWTVGWFILIPIVYGSDVQADKLVIARETSEGWAIRAIFDPDSKLSTSPDFMAGIDGRGSLHFLYRNYDESNAFIFAVGMGGGGYSSWDFSEREMRYARVPLERLLSANAGNVGSGPGQTGDRSSWLNIEGMKVEAMPFMAGPNKDKPFQNIIAPVHRHFAFNPDSGDIDGIIHPGGYNISFDDGVRKAGPDDSPWLQVKVKDGKWDPHFDVVTARDIPDPGRRWLFRGGLIKSGYGGNDHVLVSKIETGFFSATFDICYLRKKADKWSAPLALGHDTDSSGISDLALDEKGRIFAAWKSKDGSVAGRWILPGK